MARFPVPAISIYTFSLLLTLGSCDFTPKSAARPNIIVILVDDAGYADFGFMGSPDLLTPNIDQLARRGMIFTDAHVTASVCGPSRAGLMTGQYQQRFGFECNPPARFSGIDLTVPTLAEVLGSAGYKTAAFGKWHLGDIPEARPLARGFDYFWGFLAGGRHYFPHPENDQLDNLRSIQENAEFTTFEGYLTDVLGDKAVDYIDRNVDNPFFMYWSPNAVHTPMEATEEDLSRFENHPRQTLAAMTWALDRSVGKIVKKLEEADILDNTLIFFLSDNGGATNNQSTNGPLKGFKGNEFEGGHRVAFAAHWPAAIKPGQKFDGLTSSLDIFATSVAVAGGRLTANHRLDGVSLVPYFAAEMDTEPHGELFWRKEGMAAAREGGSKLLRIDNLGQRLYDLKSDLGETRDLSQTHVDTLQRLSAKLFDWEQNMETPRWTESKAWNQVTWFIHRDLFENRIASIKNPSQLPERVVQKLK